jgi:hypothetical protein
VAGIRSQASQKKTHVPEAKAVVPGKNGKKPKQSSPSSFVKYEKKLKAQEPMEKCGKGGKKRKTPEGGGEAKGSGFKKQGQQGH